MSKTMEALVKKHATKGLWLDEVPVPEVGPDDVLIKVKKASICGTDLHIYNWDDWAQNRIKTPLIIGHEFAGIIEKTGSNVIDYKPGDSVSAEGHIVCGKCRNCLAGRKHLCKNTKGLGIDRPGAFAQYVSIPCSNIWRNEGKISEETVSCFDPLGNAVHTALSFDIFGEDVLITGAGPIGIMAVAVARHAGARHIVVTDMNTYRLKIAEKMGATITIDIREKNIKNAFNELGMKEGFDVGLEMSGSESALNNMISNMRHGGKIALLGIQPPRTIVDLNSVIFNGITIKGIYGREIYETWYKMASMIQSGLDISPVITHRLSYKDFNQGFEIMQSGKCGKVILQWDS
jgi:threonine 3-dehydrogenase